MEAQIRNDDAQESTNLQENIEHPVPNIQSGSSRAAEIKYFNMVSLVKTFIEDALANQENEEDVCSLESAEIPPSHVQQQYPVIFSKPNLSIFLFLDRFMKKSLKNFSGAKGYLCKLNELGELSSDAVKILTEKLNAITLDDWKKRALDLALLPIFSTKDFHKLLEERANYLKNFSISSDDTSQAEGETSLDASSIDDAFLFSLITYSCLTKGIIASYKGFITDSKGLAEPVTLRAKLFFQDVCRVCKKWDEPLPPKIYPNWMLFRLDLKNLTVFKFPRCGQITNEKNIELHGFFEISKRAYGACVYLRSPIEEDKWEARLYYAKSRVVPINKYNVVNNSIEIEFQSKLKFYAAQLLSKMMLKNKSEAKVNTRNCYYWTTHIDVLVQIKDLSNKDEEIKKIQNTSPPQAWRLISSTDNPANIVCRGANTQSLETNSLWWSGPDWLALDANEWPVLNESTYENED